MHARARVSRSPILGIGMLLLAATLPAQATGASPALVADPPRIELEDLEVGRSSKLDITVTNQSGERLLLDEVEVTETTFRTLMSANGCFNPINDGSSCVVRLSAKVTEPGIHRETLTVGTSDGRFSVIVRILLTAPDVNPPVVMFGPANRSMTRAFLPPKRQARFLWEWYAADDVGVTRYTTQMRVGTSAWQRVVYDERMHGTTQYARITVPTDKGATIRTRAYDPWGNASAWAPVTVRTRYQNVVPDHAISGTWRAIKAEGTFRRDLLVTRRNTASVSVTATGRGVYLLGRKGPGQGGVRLSADGGEWDYVDLVAGKRRDLQVIGSFFWDEVGTHTVTAIASVFPWRPTVALDAWVIME